MLHPAPSTCLFLSSLLQRARCELFFQATSKLPSHKLRREKTSNKSIWPRVSLAREPSLAHVRALSPLLGKTWPLHHNSKKSYLCFAGLFFLCCHLQHLIVHSEAAPKSRWWSVGRVGGDLFDVPLHSVKQWPECNYSHWTYNSHQSITNVRHFQAQSNKQFDLTAQNGNLQLNTSL